MWRRVLRRDASLAATAGLTVSFAHSCRATTTTRFERGGSRRSRGGRIGVTRGGVRPVRAADGASDRGFAGALRRTGRVTGRSRHARNASGCSASSPCGTREDARKSFRFAVRQASGQARRGMHARDGDAALRRHPATLRPWSVSSPSAITLNALRQPRPGVPAFVRRAFKRPSQPRSRGGTQAAPAPAQPDRYASDDRGRAVCARSSR